jgi:ubiquitin-like 1-activating enzyme E1 B
VWGSAEKSKLVGTFAFDKDDKMAMRFVAAAANLRGSVFCIDQLCFHDVKGVAGNIIPALATTNAIVAGQQVEERDGERGGDKGGGGVLT